MPSSSHVVECAPAGYPQFSLVARSFHVPARSSASPARLRKALERWEDGNSLSGFEFRSMERAPIELAQEAAHVYVALRERHPMVSPSYVDMASKQMSVWYRHLKPDSQPLALATTYGFLAPLRELSPARQDPFDVVAALDEDDPRRSEWEELLEHVSELGVRDVWLTGGIDLCRSFASRRAYNELLALRQRNRQPDWVSPRRTVHHELGVLGYSLVHEFGHLVDAELCAAGDDAVAHVYGALSQAVLGLSGRPRIEQWAAHLANYPQQRRSSRALKSAPLRERQVRSGVGLVVADVLGKYASTCRDELFAEAFVAMWAAKDRGLRKRLVPVRRAMCDVGLAVSRLPSRR